jgi:hypothetical protein
VRAVPALLVLLAPAAHAATVRVPEDAPTVQAGLAMAGPCDEVVVGPGTWSGVFDVPRGVTLRGAGPSTILDGEGAEEVVLLTQGSRLLDVAVRNGRYGVRPHGAWSEVADVAVTEVETAVHAWSSTVWAHDLDIVGTTGAAVLVDGGEVWLDDITITASWTAFDLTSSVGRVLRAAVTDVNCGFVLRNASVSVRESQVTQGGLGAVVHGGFVSILGSSWNNLDVAIHLVDAGTDVVGNTIADVEYGIRTDYTPARIIGNTVDRASVAAIAEGYGSASLISGNLVRDGGTGLVIDLADTHAWNNTFLGTTLGAWLHLGRGDLRNCLFVGGETGIEASEAPAALVAFSAFEGVPVPGHGFDLGQHLVGDDLLLDDLTGVPQPGSPVIDAGDPANSQDDRDGTPNDIGATGGPEGGFGYVPPPSTPPTLGEQPIAQGVEGEDLVAFAMNVHDPDGDPKELTWDAHPEDGLQFCDDWGNALAFFPADDGEWQVALRLRGPGGEEAQTTVTLRADNQPPELQVSPLSAAAEGQPLGILVDAWDPGPADTLTWMLDVDGDGATDLSGMAPGLAEWTPPQSGPWSLALTVADDDGAFVSENMEVDVTNLPPMLLSPLPDLAIVGEPLERTLQWADPSAEDVVTATLAEAPDGMTLDGDTLRWTPTEPGAWNLTLRLQDQEGATVLPQTTIQALGASAPEGCAYGSARASGLAGPGILAGILLLVGRRRAPSPQAPRR